MQPKDVAVAAHELVRAVAGDPAEGGTALGVDHEARVHRQPAHVVARCDLALVEVADVVARDVQVGDAGPAAVDGLLGEVLLGVQAERGGLHTHGEVFGDDRDLLPVLGEVHRDREDAGVVVAQAETCREHRGIRVGEFDAQRAVLTDGNGKVEPAVLDPQLVEVTQRLPGEIPEFGVVAFGLEFGDHHHRDDDRVLGETEECARIAQEHRRVEHVGAEVLIHPRRLVEVLLLLWNSCGHNPLPPRVRITRQSRVDQGHESWRGRPDRAPCPM